MEETAWKHVFHMLKYKPSSWRGKCMFSWHYFVFRNMRKTFTLFRWPPQLPYLNTIEHLWEKTIWHQNIQHFNLTLCTALFIRQGVRFFTSPFNTKDCHSIESGHNLTSLCINCIKSMANAKKVTYVLKCFFTRSYF